MTEYIDEAAANVLKESEGGRSAADTPKTADNPVQKIIGNMLDQLREEESSFRQEMTDLRNEREDDSAKLSQMVEYARLSLEEMVSIKESINELCAMLQEKAVKYVDSQSELFTGFNKVIHDVCFEQITQYKEVLCDDSTRFADTIGNVLTSKNEMLAFSGNVSEKFRDRLCVITESFSRTTSELLDKVLDAKYGTPDFDSTIQFISDRWSENGVSERLEKMYLESEDAIRIAAEECDKGWELMRERLNEKKEEFEKEIAKLKEQKQIGKEDNPV